MKNMTYSILCSLGAACIVIFAIVIFGTQTFLEIYTSNTIQNCLLLFVVFLAATAGVEIFQEIGSFDPVIDLIFDMAVAIITTYHYYQQGIILFDGLTPLRTIVKCLTFPLIGVILISSINFSSKIEKLKSEK